MIYETRRLILRPRTMTDLEACFAMDRAPGVLDYIPGNWQDPGEHRVFIKSRIMQDYGKGLGYWSIFPKSDPEQFMGWILLTPVNDTAPEIEIGWRLHPDFHGNGFALEAACEIVGHAFARLELPRIIAMIDPRNIPSRKLARRLGMHMEPRKTADGYDLFSMTIEDFTHRQGTAP